VLAFYKSYLQGGCVPSEHTTVEPPLGGTTTVVFFSGGGALLLLIQPDNPLARHRDARTRMAFIWAAVSVDRINIGARLRSGSRTLER
jgi:hypothetical protein